mmetsp:Transcript_20548/g.26540  ORF Transcript_20548/g.26540 Transcript_20548/m.26540 type:complete len:362 (-) Transcript_20548:1784-2869(-)
MIWKRKGGRSEGARCRWRLARVVGVVPQVATGLVVAGETIGTTEGIVVWGTETKAKGSGPHYLPVEAVGVVAGGGGAAPCPNVIGMDQRLSPDLAHLFGAALRQSQSRGQSRNQNLPQNRNQGPGLPLLARRHRLLQSARGQVGHLLPPSQNPVPSPGQCRSQAPLRDLGLAHADATPRGRLLRPALAPVGGPSPPRRRCQSCAWTARKSGRTGAWGVRSAAPRPWTETPDARSRAPAPRAHRESPRGKRAPHLPVTWLLPLESAKAKGTKPGRLHPPQSWTGVVLMGVVAVLDVAHPHTAKGEGPPLVGRVRAVPARPDNTVLYGMKERSLRTTVQETDKSTFIEESILLQRWIAMICCE